ncbi:MAG: endonuclease/exonuclease/phosphatase family protein, partial [Aestuariivirgaceae bacterium]
PDASAQPVKWDRPLLHGVVRLPDGDALHLINLHLRAPLAAPVAGQKTGPFSWRSASGWAEGFYIAMLKRSGQALEVRMLIDRIFDTDPDALILVCGDFNAAEREVPARIIGAGVDDTGNGALAGRALVYLERTVPPAQRFSVIHHGEKLMLDHILISHQLLAHYRHFEVHNELLGDELFGYSAIADNPESYHAPVVAEFDF